MVSEFKQVLQNMTAFIYVCAVNLKRSGPEGRAFVFFMQILLFRYGVGRYFKQTQNTENTFIHFIYSRYASGEQVIR